MATSDDNPTVSGGAATHVIADSRTRGDAAAREYTAPPSGRSVLAQVAAVLAVLASVWVAISPWFLTLGRRGTANDLIVGLVVAGFAVILPARPRTTHCRTENISHRDCFPGAG